MVDMKKLKAIFNKQKKSKENLNGYYSDAIPETARTLPKANFPMDICLKERTNGFNGTMFSGERLGDRRVCLPRTEAFENSDFEVFEKGFGEEGTKRKEPNKSNGSLIENTAILNESCKLNYDLESNLALEKHNTGSKTYVFNISNCKYFHIGPKKTVYTNDLIKESPQGSKFKDWLNSNAQVEKEENLCKLLDSEERLTEENIILISLHVSDKWKEFGRSLGVKEEILEEIEWRNERDDSLAAYDTLESFIDQYPNTSLGFVVNALKEASQVTVIQKLAEKIKGNENF